MTETSRQLVAVEEQLQLVRTRTSVGAVRHDLLEQRHDLVRVGAVAEQRVVAELEHQRSKLRMAGAADAVEQPEQLHAERSGVPTRHACLDVDVRRAAMRLLALAHPVVEHRGVLVDEHSLLVERQERTSHVRSIDAHDPQRPQQYEADDGLQDALRHEHEAHDRPGDCGGDDAERPEVLLLAQLLEFGLVVADDVRRKLGFLFDVRHAHSFHSSPRSGAEDSDDSRSASRCIL